MRVLHIWHSASNRLAVVGAQCFFWSMVGPAGRSTMGLSRGLYRGSCEDQGGLSLLSCTSALGSSCIGGGHYAGLGIGRLTGGPG